MKKLSPAITLVEAPRKMAICETDMRYDIKLFGMFYEEAAFNMTGYIAYLPSCDFVSHSCGEHSISRVRKEIALLNKEWAALASGLIAIANMPPDDKVAVQIKGSPDSGDRSVYLYGVKFSKAWDIGVSGYQLLLPKPCGGIEFLSENVTPAKGEAALARINALWASA